MYKYIIILAALLCVIFAYIHLYIINNKEGAQTQIKSGDKSVAKKDETYFSPREFEIDQINSYLDKLNSTMPITFSTGTIEYDRIDKPIVTFSGEIPYIFINIKLPYPLAGEQGDRGARGNQGEKGEKGETGEPGARGYTGSGEYSFLYQG